MKNEVIHLDTIVVRPDYDDNETKKMQIVIIS
ncbi:Uncharacterised protein [Campylobacter ureolyticus]|uniref:Uncharacterized protein n=1 Tax=Campylobacter ureolyticus TaxID=827 RepID=A0A6N2QX47_9BACT